MNTVNKKITGLSQSDYEADAKLVAKASAGSREALTELCSAIARGVLYRVKYSIENISDAEDISQEVLMQVCKKIHELRSPEAFRVWLGKIIIGETNRYLKKGMKHRDVLNISDYIDVIVEDREPYLPEEFTESADARRAVLDAILKLPARQRQVVVFYYFDGLHISDISEALELAPSSVSTHLVRARESIKTEILKNSPTSSGTVKKFRALPIGIILFDIIKEDSVSFSILDKNWLQGVLAHCQETIAAEAITANKVRPGGAASTGMFILKCTAICILGAICCGVMMIDFKSSSGPPVTWVESAAIGEGKIVFSGGETYRGTNRINPLSAHAVFDDTAQSLSISQWSITTRENDSKILFQGYGSDVDISSLELLKNHRYGEYMIKFLLECESGAVYRMRSNFYIKELYDIP